MFPIRSAVFRRRVVAGLLYASFCMAAAYPLLAGEIGAPTLGGKQFWADVRLFHGYRIQRWVLTGSYRLLDEHDRLQAEGTLEECAAALDRIREEQQLPPMSGKAVILLHGLARSRSSMQGLADYLQEHGGYATFCVGYPSTQGTIGEHAAQLAEILAHLEGIEEINFVAHSLGNLVVRHYVADCLASDGAQPLDPRIKRMVMLGPPNHGSRRAEAWAGSNLFDLVLGDTGQQLASGWTELEAQLATPPFEFGIIAGGRGDDEGWNATEPGDDDGTVSVATTQLAGARDFIVIRTRHAFLMSNAQSREYALHFLQDGCFSSEEERRPILDDPPQ